MSTETRAKCRVKCDCCRTPGPWTFLQLNQWDAYIQAWSLAEEAGWRLVPRGNDAPFECCPSEACYEALVAAEKEGR